MAKGLGMAWQVQLLIAGTVIGGGYLAYINRFPPFDQGGLFDQLTKFLPQHKGKGNSLASQDGSDNTDTPDMLGGDQSGGIDPASLRAAQNPNSTGSTVLPNGNIFNPLLGGMQIPGGGMTTSRASDPTSGEMNVYDNYVKALQMQFGAQNSANLGPMGGPPGVVGDPNLGTTPVPSSLFQQQGMGMNPPGYPPMGGMPSQFGRPSMPPGNPFLPNPTQYPGPVQPGPYPSHPPVMAPPPPFPQNPFPPSQPPFDFGGFQNDNDINNRRRGAPFFSDVNEIMGIDVGDIHVGLDGIRVGDLINISGNERDVFPNGVDRYNKAKFEKDLQSYINRLLRKVNGKNSKARTKALRAILKARLGANQGQFGQQNNGQFGQIFSGAGFVMPDKAAYMQFNHSNSLQPFLRRNRSGGQDPTFRMKLGNQR